MWQKFLKSTYRREPITSFVMTMALVELGIGGLEQELPLLGLAAVMAGGAIALRYCAGSQSGSRSSWRSNSSDITPGSQYYLPPAAPRQVLPHLTDKIP